MEAHQQFPVTAYPCAYQEWLPPRRPLPVPGAGRAAEPSAQGCASGTQPCRASRGAGLPDSPDTKLHMVTTHNVRAEKKPLRDVGITWDTWNLHRWVTAIHTSGLHHHCTEGFSPNHLESLLIKNCLVEQCENVGNDCSRVHVVHFLITGASKNAFICQRAYSAQLSNG